MKSLIRNGTVVSPHGAFKADLLLDEGRIAAVGENLGTDLGADQSAAAQIIDAADKIIFPGAVDAHTHITLDLDKALGSDLFYSGTLPALAGGTTTIIDHLAFAPQGRDPARQLALYQSLAQGNSAVDYAFHGLVQGGRNKTDGADKADGTDKADGADESDEADLAALELFRDFGASSVKAYMTYAGRLDRAALGAFIGRCARLGLLPAVHCEDQACLESALARCLGSGALEPQVHAQSRPPDCEARAVADLLALAAEAGDAPVYIVHLSTALGLAAIKKARAAGQKNIFVETCPQYLCLTDECYSPAARGAGYIMSPPLRKREDCEELWRGLRDGDIQTVATDHCSFTLAEKAPGGADFTRCPGGAPGLEERLPVMFSQGPAKGRLSLERLAEVLAANPAKLMGLYPQKGALLPGSDADLVIFDPKAQRRLQATDLHGPGDYSIYEGLELKGAVEQVFLRGRRVFYQGAFLPELKGAGHFLPRQTFMDAR